MSNPAVPAVPLRTLDYRQTADALQEALERHREGLAEAAMTRTLTGVVAELLASALLDAGYVVALPKPATRQGTQTRASQPAAREADQTSAGRPATAHRLTPSTLATTEASSPGAS